ncbi:MAG TPA: hypothetical protein VFW19_17795 [Allosphingosinicella sp.]|nr:hypothetical protein [Allosphingosinicella sp.]
MQTTLTLAITATALIGPGAGMSLDQAIKQLPARHKIGIAAFSAYSRAGDHGNGLWLYPAVGIGALICSIVAAISGNISASPPAAIIPLDTSAGLAILHSLATARAAPLNLSQKRYPLTDETNLARIFDGFARWNALRAVLQVLNFVAGLWAIVVLAKWS